jgi:hypothetical protein
MQDAALAQIVQILADGLLGDVEAVGKALDAQPSFRLGQRHDVRLPRRQQMHLPASRRVRFRSFLAPAQADDDYSNPSLSQI